MSQSHLQPQRTCVGCRVRADRSALLRVVAQDGAVVPDVAAILPGRGAWVHATEQCISAAIKRRAFGRALRVQTALSIDAVVRAASSDLSS